VSSFINGLILAGGSSSRMGRDKSMIDVHGMPQWKYSLEILSEFCENTWISLRPNHILKDVPEDQIIIDQYENMGPIAGILSAFEFDKETAWLTLACDLPLVDEQLLEQLIFARNQDKIATAFWENTKDFPEPLICIWEPKAFHLISEKVSSGIKSPGKILIDCDANFIEPLSSKALLNLNYPEDLEIVREIINR